VYETHSLTFREEYRLSVFGNMVLTKIFGPKRNDVRGDWRKLRQGEASSSIGLLLVTYYSGDYIKN
jgi:hypothetical protein